MRPETTSLAAALLIALTGCAGPPAVPADPSEVDMTDRRFVARGTPEGLELTNNTGAPIYYRSRDPLSLALSDRIPCLEPTDCPSVPARAKRTVPFEDAIVGYRPETERVLVYWWHFVQQPDGSADADRVRTFEIELASSSQ